MERWIVFYVALCGLIAEAGCAASSTPASVSTTYTASLEAAPAPNGSPSVVSAVVLYDQQFIDPFNNVAVITVSITPSPAHMPAISWTSSSSSVVVQPQEPAFASPAPTAPPAPPAGTFAAIGSTYGAAVVSAQIGSPVNQLASIQVYHYPSLSLGCRFRYAPAFSFDPGSSPNGTASDLYATIGSDQVHSLDPCQNSVFLTAVGTPEMWHAPYGAVLFAGIQRSQFPNIQPTQWQNAATDFKPQEGVLLFKTRGGRSVKAYLPIGPYEVSDGNGQFPY